MPFLLDSLLTFLGGEHDDCVHDAGARSRGGPAYGTGPPVVAAGGREGRPLGVTAVAVPVSHRTGGEPGRDRIPPRRPPAGRGTGRRPQRLDLLPGRLSVAA